MLNFSITSQLLTTTYNIENNELISSMQMNEDSN